MSTKRICVVLATWTALWACPTRSQADGITFDSASRNAYAEVRSDATGSIIDDELLTGTGTGLLTQHAEASYINTSGPSPTESSADGYQDTSLVILAESIAFTGSVSGSWIRGGAAGERLDGYGYASVSFTPDESAWYDLDVTSSGTGSGGTGSILVYLYDLTTHAFVFSEATPGAFQFQGALEASHSYQFTAYARALDRTGGSGSYEYDNAYANFDFAVGTQPVPEPGTLALVGLGAAGLAAHRRRRRRRRYHARA